MDKKTIVSIIIVNYKTIDLVKNCIDSIVANSSGFSYETIVVDNSDSDFEFERLQTALLSFNNVKAINAHGNIGFGLANNLGVSHAKGDYFLFLNSDTVLINNAIKEMLLAFGKEKNAGAVGANLFTCEMECAHSFERHPTTIREIKRSRSFFSSCQRKIFHSTNFNKTKKIIEINGYLSGACLMIPRTVFFLVKGFDKDIFMYSEDNLICTEIRKNGYILLNTPKAKVMHLEGGSGTKIWSDSKVQNYVNGGYIFFLKVYGLKIANKFLNESSKINKKLFLRGGKKDLNQIKLSIAYAKKFKQEIARKSK